VAARWLARTPLSEAQLAARLGQKGYSAGRVAATVARCRELGWVGDRALALDRARALRRRGAGPLRIVADLTARGVPERFADEAVAESRDGAPETEWARRALGHEADRPRAWRLLLSRGFPEDVVGDVVGDVSGDADES
jgi:regulatory protein